MPISPTRKLTKRDIRELEDALTVAKTACERIQKVVGYGTNLYDAGADVIRTCTTMEKEAGSERTADLDIGNSFEGQAICR